MYRTIVISILKLQIFTHRPNSLSHEMEYIKEGMAPQLGNPVIAVVVLGIWLKVRTGGTENPSNRSGTAQRDKVCKCGEDPHIAVWGYLKMRS